MTPDHDLPADAWTNGQLIPGVLELVGDNERLAEQRDALVRELESMKKTLQKEWSQFKD